MVLLAVTTDWSVTFFFRLSYRVNIVMVAAFHKEVIDLSVRYSRSEFTVKLFAATDQELSVNEQVLEVTCAHASCIVYKNLKYI